MGGWQWTYLDVLELSYFILDYTKYIFSLRFTAGAPYTYIVKLEYIVQKEG
jgi:hypothetical protein